jgi:hypothetical protein
MELNKKKTVSGMRKNLKGIKIMKMYSTGNEIHFANRLGMENPEIPGVVPSIFPV